MVKHVNKRGNVKSNKPPLQPKRNTRNDNFKKALLAGKYTRPGSKAVSSQDVEKKYTWHD